MRKTLLTLTIISGQGISGEMDNHWLNRVSTDPRNPGVFLFATGKPRIFKAFKQVSWKLLKNLGKETLYLFSKIFSM